MAITGKEFEEGMVEFSDNLRKRGLRSGPAYKDDWGSHASPWYDQVFDREIAPAGSVNCQYPLRVGHTANSLDVVLIASHSNPGTLVIPAGATITLSFLESDEEKGTYKDVGPTICVKAPAGGLRAKPDEEVARFAIGNFRKPWMMVALEFAGSITGGKVDCALSLMPR